VCVTLDQEVDDTRLGTISAHVCRVNVNRFATHQCAECGFGLGVQGFNARSESSGSCVGMNMMARSSE